MLLKLILQYFLWPSNNLTYVLSGVYYYTIGYFQVFFIVNNLS